MKYTVTGVQACLPDRQVQQARVAYTLGMACVPGYPLYTLPGWLFFHAYPTLLFQPATGTYLWYVLERRSGPSEGQQ